MYLGESEGGGGGYLQHSLIPIERASGVWESVGYCVLFTVSLSSGETFPPTVRDSIIRINNKNNKLQGEQQIKRYNF